MTTARDLITSSLRLIGVVHKSEPITADEAVDALEVLNDLLASWATDSLMVYSRSWETFPLTAGVAEYTMGVGGTFNTVRPTQIISAYIRLSGSNIDYPLYQLVDDQYALYIAQKNLQSNIPEYFNFDNAYPLAKIRIWQVPSTACDIHMQSEKQVLDVPTLDTVIDLPPGWKKAIRFNLAKDLAPEYSIQPPPEVIEQAAGSKALLMQQVLKNRPLTFMPTNIGIGYDVYSDTYNR